MVTGGLESQGRGAGRPTSQDALIAGLPGGVAGLYIEGRIYGELQRRLAGKSHVDAVVAVNGMEKSRGIAGIAT